VTHSIPTAMADRSGPGGGAYPAQHRELAAEIAGRLPGPDGAPRTWDLVYCSRSGAPGQSWLEPDVNDHLRDLAAQGVAAVVLAPIGFVSDHMEVLHDIDTDCGGHGA